MAGYAAAAPLTQDWIARLQSVVNRRRLLRGAAAAAGPRPRGRAGMASGTLGLVNDLSVKLQKQRKQCAPPRPRRCQQSARCAPRAHMPTAARPTVNRGALRDPRR